MPLFDAIAAVYWTAVRLTRRAAALAVRHLGESGRAEQLERLAQARDYDPALAPRVRALIVAVLASPSLYGQRLAEAWEDLCAAVQQRDEFDGSLIGPADVDPELTGWDAEAGAVDHCDRRLDEALAVLVRGDLR